MKQAIIGIFISIAITLIIVVAVVYHAIVKPLPDNLTELPSVTLHIPQGASFSQVLDSLEAQQLIQHPALFRYFAGRTGLDRRMPAGYFKVPKGLTEWQLVQYLKKPRQALVKVTLPEGIRTEKMAAILRARLKIDSARFVQLVYDSSFARQLGVPAPTANGFLMPETYFLPMGLREEKIIEILVRPTLNLFAEDSVRQQLKKLQLTPLQIITLASIIEGEAQVDSERTLIASVYYNRLKRGWRLQADPTIQYLIKDGPRRLTYRDLQIDSPYNTYKYKGLPPGPINNPGKQSILAALFPANTRYMYFVATGDGGHHFSATLREHNRWKKRFDAYRRQVYRQKRQGHK